MQEREGFVVSDGMLGQEREDFGGFDALSHGWSGGEKENKGVSQMQNLRHPQKFDKGIVRAKEKASLFVA